MNKKSSFLNWFIFFNLICIGTVLAGFFGVFGKVNNADVTKLSFLIAGIFFYYTFLMGWRGYRAAFKPVKGLNGLERDEKLISTISFIADLLLSLGMMGTIIGFILTLGTSFAEISAANPAAMKAALHQMATGMGTALYTTASGLAGSILLRVQVYHFKRIIQAAAMYERWAS